MRNGFLGSLAALALGGGLAVAQSWGPYAPPRPMLPPGPPPGMNGAPVPRGADGRPLPVNFGPTLEDLDSAFEAPPAGDTPPAAPAVKPPAGKPGPAPAAPPAPGAAALPDVHEEPGMPLEGAEIGAPLGPPGPPFGSPGQIPPEPKSEHDWFWLQADYLLWWYKAGTTPPLLTSGGNGVLGGSGTTAAIDHLDFNDSFRNGGEFRGGLQFGSLPMGLEARYFFLDDRTMSKDVSSDGSTLLGRPYFNTALDREDVFVIASPGSPGSFHVETRTRLSDIDWNLACAIEGNECWSVVGLLGFRYMELAEDLRTTDQFTTEPLVPIFGPVPAVVSDQFHTRNQMYAGQLGAEFEYHRGPLFLNARFEGVLGDNRQRVLIQGSSVLTTAGGKVTLPVGRFAQSTNSGVFNRDEISYAPEVGLNVGWQLTKRIRIHAGYTFLFWDNVVRPGNQIDRGVNPNQVPTAVGPGGPLGAPRPAFAFRDGDFWAQGLNAGFEFHY